MMSRDALFYEFNDGVGKDIDKYVGNDDKFLDFLDWYRDFLMCSNEILFVLGKNGSGRSTFISYCLNFIGKKANYDILKIKGLKQASEEFEQLPHAKSVWISASELDKSSLVNSICRKIRKPPVHQRVLGAFKLSSSLSQGPGSPEITFDLGYNRSDDYSIEALISFLKKDQNGKYVVWLQSLSGECFGALLNMHRTLMSQGITNLGIIVSTDAGLTLKDGDPPCRTIQFFSPSEAELGIFIAFVCRPNEMRFDSCLAEYLLSHGIDTFGKAQRFLQGIEKMNPEYISLENARIKMEEANHE